METLFAVAYSFSLSSALLNSLARRDAASRIEKNKLINRFFVAHTQVSLGSKKFFRQEVSKKLQVNGGISEGGVHSGRECDLDFWIIALAYIRRPPAISRKL